ncbi:MAG: NAD(P)/FAD-dependent oxidoreductase, partial [Gramella sp.]|nr:NAD(P)/FAD-dependent oxidoreductase [Christiangramia sp.]
NIKDVYAIGDCAQQRSFIGLRKPVEAVWYTGRIMGGTLAQTLTGKRTAYTPGNWFNSAKFFDIEYQTYGWVWAEPREGEQHFHWKHKNENKAITVAYQTENRKFTGINTFGIRMRQEVFDRWLNENRSIDFVMEHLKEANFDPEFYDTHEKEIYRSFRSNLQEA